MTYVATEESVEDGRPVELYLLENAAGDSFAYTSGNVDVVYGSHTYTPEAIKRTSPTLSNKAASAKLTLTFPDSKEWAQRYLAMIPPILDTLIIYRVHLTDGDSEVIQWWSGDVGGVTFEGDEAKANITTTSDRLRRTVPKRTFSWSCNHVLYDGLCQAAKSSNRSDVRVASIDSADPRLITCTNDPAWAGDLMTDFVTADLAFFNGGYCEPFGGGGHSRSILDTDTTSGYQFRLMIEIPGLVVGDILTFYAGCDHSVQTCFSKFDNVGNYGGFPFIPTNNPFETGIIDEDI